MYVNVDPSNSLVIFHTGGFPDEARRFFFLSLLLNNHLTMWLMARALFWIIALYWLWRSISNLMLGVATFQRRLKIVRSSGSNLGGGRFDHFISNWPKTERSAPPLAVTTSFFRDKQNSTNETNGVWTSSTFPQAASGEEESLDGAHSIRDNFWTAHCCYLFSLILDFIYLLCFLFRNATGFFSLSFSLFFSHSVFIGPINIIRFFPKKWQIMKVRMMGREWSFLPNVIHELMLIFEMMLIFLKKNKMPVQVSHLFLFLFFFFKSSPSLFHVTSLLSTCDEWLRLTTQILCLKQKTSPSHE